MAKRRYQDPEPEVVGNWWQVRVYRDEYSDGRRIRKRIRIRLAPASMPVREVQKIKAEYLRPLNQGLISAGSAMPFESFAETVYITTALPLMASSTQDRYRGIIDNYLVPTFGSLCLRDLTPLTLQKYLSGFEIREPQDNKQKNPEPPSKKKRLSRESVDKVRDVLSSVLGSAVKYGFLVSNPAGALQLPPSKRGARRQKPFVRPEQFAELVELIQEPYATMVYVAVYTGLRVSEVIGLRWSDIHEQSITIDERYCPGGLGGAEERCFQHDDSGKPKGDRAGSAATDVDGGGEGGQGHQALSGREIGRA